ncbi:MAG: hypothetical protein WB494_01885, partial [Pseudomonas alloputida]
GPSYQRTDHAAQDFLCYGHSFQNYRDLPATNCEGLAGAIYVQPLIRQQADTWSLLHSQRLEHLMQKQLGIEVEIQ